MNDDEADEIERQIDALSEAIDALLQGQNNLVVAFALVSIIGGMLDAAQEHDTEAYGELARFFITHLDTFRLEYEASGVRHDRLN